MTKKIKNFGVPIGGGRTRRQSRIPGQGSKAIIWNDRKESGEEYSKADKIKEEEGVYNTQPRVSHNRKKQYQLPKLTSVNRTGPEYLPGGRHADERDFKTLGIKGVEFGVSLSDEEAQVAMDACYLAFCDLARVLNIDKRMYLLGNPFPFLWSERTRRGRTSYL